MAIETFYGSLPDALEEEARYLRSELAAIHRAYQDAARPYLDRLATIESLRPVRYVFLSQATPKTPTA